MKHIATLFFLVLSLSLSSQQSIDSGFAFQNDNFKKYSIYVPSTYDENTPNALMLGLHPLNTNRWDAQAWRDTLINFAETNNLLLLCPDGGSDGRIDDSIDTAFTTVLMDSVGSWFNIDRTNQYIMGFSWGGKTTYTYGLRRTDQFKGYLVIGAAINGSSEIANIVSNAQNEAFYLIHGSADLLSTRYTPLLQALQNNGACTESNVMQGVGHTIDFPNRNQILTDGFRWLESSSCGLSVINNDEILKEIVVYPNPSSRQFTLQGLNIEPDAVEIYNIKGEFISFNREKNNVSLQGVASGLYFIGIRNKDQLKILKIIIE